MQVSIDFHTGSNGSNPEANPVPEKNHARDKKKYKTMVVKEILPRPYVHFVLSLSLTLTYFYFIHIMSAVALPLLCGLLC